MVDFSMGRNTLRSPNLATVLKYEFLRFYGAQYTEITMTRGIDNEEEPVFKRSLCIIVEHPRQ